MYEERQAPVKEGEEYEVEIGAVGEKGDGIARVKGFVLFVKGAKKGDYLKVRVVKVLAKVGFGEVVKKLEKTAKEKRFVEVKPEEEERKEESSQEYEDTEDFGGDIEKE